MSNFQLITDSACDLGLDYLKSINVKSVSLTLKFDGEDLELKNDDIDPKEFYDKMRAGGTAKTAAVNVDGFKKVFEETLKEGKDILHLGFSSGLSTTYNSARLAAEELSESYPDRKIITLDSLAASAGFGMLVYLVAQKRDEGATLEEAAEYAKATIPNLVHWFTVDDLVYLKRGGRVSPAVAFVGGLLGIKPVMHVDDEGHLIKVTTARGRSAAIKALADKFGETALDNTKGPVMICHGDCEEDAKKLSDIIETTYGVKTDMTVFTGPVIGAHSGPGTLALFYLGKER
ncbi:MAG: DegV family protein [Clostridia bacterium]|nr:DegV family protein [Clostridia bacterium]